MLHKRLDLQVQGCCTKGVVPVLHAALLASLCTSPGLEWRASVAAQIDPAPHGDLQLGLRLHEWSIELFTDTVDLRYSGEHVGGRHWIALRGEFLAAGLLNAPWSRGAPDPSSGLTAMYAGADAGWYDYFGAGFYAGFSGWARHYFFFAQSKTAITVPEPTLIFAPSAVLGWWSKNARVEVVAGADLGEQRASPRIAVEAQLRPDWWLAPRVEVRAGAAFRQDFLTLTRIGGLNPHVVPLAGAGWAEWWAEDYASVRAGPSLKGELGEIALVVDAATFDGDAAYGLAALGTLHLPWFVIEGALGFAPEIPRQTGVSRVAAWLRVARDWSAF